MSRCIRTMQCNGFLFSEEIKLKDLINFNHPPQRFDHQQSSRRNNCRIRRLKNNSRIRHKQSIN